MNRPPSWPGAALSGPHSGCRTYPVSLTAQGLTPLQRLQRLQESGLTECGGAGEPIHLVWRQSLRARGSSFLVIDATDFDPKARGSAGVLGRRPLAPGRGRADRRRPARQPQGGTASPFTIHKAARPPSVNTADSIRSLAQLSAPRFAAGGATRDAGTVAGAKDVPSAVPSLSTRRRPGAGWRGCSPAPPNLDSTTPDPAKRNDPARSGGACAYRAISAARLKDWGGGPQGPDQDPLLIFDDGLGGFPAHVPGGHFLRSPFVRFGGHHPGAVLTGCFRRKYPPLVVQQTRRALYRLWQLADDEGPSIRGLLIRAARLTSELTLGRGDSRHPRRSQRPGRRIRHPRARLRLAAGQFPSLLPP